MRIFKIIIKCIMINGKVFIVIIVFTHNKLRIKIVIPLPFYFLLYKQKINSYLTRGRCNSVFHKILLIVIPKLLFHGIAQNFRWNMRIASDDIDIISVILPHQRTLQLHFFENSSDSHNLASIAWNNAKLNIR